MPIRKPQLSRADKAAYLACLQQLQAEGIGVEIPDDWLEPCPLKITPSRGPGTVGNLGGSNTVYEIGLCMVAQSRVVVADYAISCPWDDQIDLPYLTERGGHKKFGPLNYLATEVLNDRFDKPFVLNRGYHAEGLIIAYGCAPIPEQYAHGAIVPLQLTFTDTLERKIEVELRLLVERRAKQMDAAVRPGRGLYGPWDNQEVSEAVISEGTRECQSPEDERCRS